MNMNEYQTNTAKARYGDWCAGKRDVALYLCTGLAGEVGEVCNIVKKAARDNGGKLTPEALADLKSELGDALWYLTELATAAGLSLDEVARENVSKIAARLEAFRAKEKAAKTESEAPKIDFAVAIYLGANFTGMQIPYSPFDTSDAARNEAKRFLTNARGEPVTLRMYEITCGSDAMGIGEPTYTYAKVAGRVVETPRPKTEANA